MSVQAFRWLTLILGVTLCLGVFTLSPIPVPGEDEWEEFGRMMRNPLYRLPTTTKPSRYEVSLTPYFNQIPSPNIAPFSFDGEVSVYITANEPDVKEIVMHCNDLTIESLQVTLNNVQVELANNTFTCEMPYSFLRIPLKDPLQVNQVYVVKSVFKGNLQQNMRGFYRSWYRDGGVISFNVCRWMGTTQFQPGHARQAFPCYDEPGFKATFDITIIRAADFSPTIANMPMKSNITLNNGRVAETFHTTPIMSTYLIAFIVSHYERISSGTNSERPFGIYARESAGRTGDYALEVGEKLLNQMEKFTDFPYYTMADKIDMKQAAIPDFSAGAMENWGLLTYREALILYDAQNVNHFYKQRIANIVSHEITHMWFGNLVTCAWWDNLWLNEGFARFYQYYLTHKVEPDFGYDIRFIPEQVHQAMMSDSVDSAVPMNNPAVNDPSSVSAHFSVITYARGASILRMTQHFLGNDTYTKGLRRYLKARAFDVAEPHHLFENLEAAAQEDNALAGYGGITIDSFFRSWSDKAGHPVLNVEINQRTGEMLVKQQRWERDTGVSQFSSLWEIPITWTRGGAPDFKNLKPSEVITGRTTSIKRGTLGLEWVIFNKQESGFYKVNYDQTNWNLITRALRSDERTVIHELNRAQIVDDVFNFARAGVMRYNRAFNILSFLEREDAYAPWDAARAGFNFALGRLASDSENLQKLQEEIIKLSTAVTDRLGYAEKEGEKFMDGLLRMNMLSFLCNVGHAQCEAAAKENFAKWRNGGHIPPNMRPWVYCSGLRQGTAEDFNYFWSRYEQEDVASETVVMINAAGCTRDQASLVKFLDAIVYVDNDNDIHKYVRPQDWSAAWSSAASGNPENAWRILEWLLNNIAKVQAANNSAATPISNIASRLQTEQELEAFTRWLEANRVALGSAYNTGINGVAATRNNHAWTRNRAGEFANYFETGYVEEEISEGGNDGGDSGGGDSGGGDSGGGGGGSPDGASMATFSVITLIATLVATLIA
ncbi:membrane alanyl aminopeptidase-like [Bicyclus anynana]|uniref:Membrane alanyl aminopeptidase-like n=1 Tax=Bicyclus anynana TaxID=110368 RepID=A0ABM3LNX2_BICAN|nr:membrane alanyl aminopeptidase-like [Bicyclus anynana]